MLLQRKDIRLQTGQLALQRDELKLQRAEMARMSDEAEKSNRIQASTNFLMGLNHRMDQIGKLILDTANSFPDPMNAQNGRKIRHAHVGEPDPRLLKERILMAHKNELDQSDLGEGCQKSYRKYGQLLLFHVADLFENAKVADCEALVPVELKFLVETIENIPEWHPQKQKVASTVIPNEFNWL